MTRHQPPIRYARRRRARVHARSWAEPLERRTLLSLSLVADTNTDTEDSWPNGFAESGGILYFAANDGAHGDELWKTDGTPQGTSLVKDIDPRPAYSYPVDEGIFTDGGSRPTGLTDLDGTLFFFADDSVHGAELWKSDGTAAGTVMVKDINPGAGGSNDLYIPGEPNRGNVSFAQLGGQLYFFATDDAGGRSLWRTDGTAAGTVPVKAMPGLPVDARIDLLSFGDRLYFQGNDSTTGSEPWISDGTPGGTVLLKDTRPGPASSAPGQFIAAGGSVSFVGETGTNGRGFPLYGIWRTDGTADGTRLVQDGFRVVTLGAAGQRLYAGTADDSLNGTLWKLDPDDAALQRLRGFSPGLYPESLNHPHDFIALNDTDVLFNISVPVLPNSDRDQLWRSDGTQTGTQLVADFLPGNGFNYEQKINVGGTVYFIAVDSRGNGLYKTDGSAAGTVRVKDLRPRPYHSTFSGFAAYRGRVLFATDAPRIGVEPWQTDGTEAGTTLLKDVNTDTRDGVSGGLARSGTTVFFNGPAADRTEEGYVLPALWASDGAGGGARRLKNIFGYDLTDVGGTLFFGVSEYRAPAGRVDLWKSDGTPEGTVRVREDTGLNALGAGLLFDFAGTLLFTAGDVEHGVELWRSDGTQAGTTLVKDIRPGANGSDIQFFDVVNGSLLFMANDGVHGRELWKTDGTAAGTVLVKDVAPGASSGLDLFNVRPVVLNGELYFPAHDAASAEPWRTRLWKSDGTGPGTTPVAGVVPGAGVSQPRELTLFDGAVYYIASDDSFGSAMFRTDGTAAGTTKVPAPAGADYEELYDLSAAGNYLYFTARQGTMSGVYRTDGTAAGTVRLVENIFGGGWTALGGKVYFTSDPTQSPGDAAGSELWETDGTPAGTRMVTDLNPGPRGSVPASLVPVGSSLFFTADDERHGREVWRLTPDDPPPPAEVVGRHVFYNNSAFDGRDPAASAADDRAVDDGKQARLPGPGQRTSFANVTSYNKGINGVMVDVVGLPAGAEGTLSAADFETVTGDGGVAIPPRSVTVRRGAGVNGSDRITLTWPDYNPASMHPNVDVVVNGWLRVAVKANERTGLARPDVFMFGNLVGATSDGPTGLHVSALDVANIKQGIRTGATNVLNPLDVNRDGRVNALDLAMVKQSLGRTLADVDLP